MYHMVFVHDIFLSRGSSQFPVLLIHFIAKLPQLLVFERTLSHPLSGPILVYCFLNLRSTKTDLDISTVIYIYIFCTFCPPVSCCNATLLFLLSSPAYLFGCKVSVQFLR